MAKLTINGLNPTTSSVRETLPANAAFVCKIIKTKIEETSFNQRLAIQVDISEGVYQGFYKKDFEAQKGGQYEARWKGVLRVNIPSEKSNHYDWDLQTFNRTIGAIEASNPGYRFADTMDTDSLKGKTVGIITREAEFNDNVFTEIGMMISAENARNGKFKPMKRRGDRTQSAPAPATMTSAFAAADDDEDVPF